MTTAGRRGLRLLPAVVLFLGLTIPAYGDGDTGSLAASLVKAVAGSGEQPTEVTSLSASVSGRTVNASGTASFGGQAPVEVGEDPVGDNAGGEAVGTAGFDIEALLISQPSASTPELRFAIDLAGLQGGGTPEATQYNWDILVDGGVTASGSNWSIKSSRTSQYYQPGSVTPYAGLFSCVPAEPPTPGFTCTQKSLLATTYDASTGEITITVPLSKLEAGAGSSIRPWDRNGEPVWIRPAVAGAVTAGGPDMDTATHDPYLVPSRSVRLGLAPANTPEGNVSFTKDASVAGNGSFTGSVTAPGSGNWDVWAKACFGSDCGTRAVRVHTN